MLLVQGGGLISTISNKQEELLIETNVPSTDRPRIHTGDEVPMNYKNNNLFHKKGSMYTIILNTGIILLYILK